MKNNVRLTSNAFATDHFLGHSWSSATNSTYGCFPVGDFIRTSRMAPLCRGTLKIVCVRSVLASVRKLRLHGCSQGDAARGSLHQMIILTCTRVHSYLLAHLENNERSNVLLVGRAARKTTTVIFLLGWVPICIGGSRRVTNQVRSVVTRLVPRLERERIFRGLYGGSVDAVDARISSEESLTQIPRLLAGTYTERHAKR